ncbi:modigliani [Cochliomyia hominivorax]
MSFDLTLSFESCDLNDIEDFPKYCDYCKFFLIEELCLEDDYRLLHYGKCSVIGKIHKAPGNDVLLENVRVTNLPNEYSLPEGTLSLHLLTSSYFGNQLQNKKYVEITGELVLFNINNPQDNYPTPLTSKGIREQLYATKNEEEHNKLLKYFQNNYKPAIKVWFVQQINRAGDLIQRNLELRMLQEQIL